MGLLDFLKRGPRKKSCARCGQAALHGYSQKAESALAQITSLCVSCLIDQLRQDYSDFRGRAVVIAPAVGLPCYVFRDRDYLRAASDARQALDIEIGDLFRESKDCEECGDTAHCLWLQSMGLSIATFEEVLKRGIRTTLLAWGNPRPLSLCGKCSGKRIAESLQGEGISYFEVCSPHGTDEGCVLPMAY